MKGSTTERIRRYSFSFYLCVLLWICSFCPAESSSSNESAAATNYLDEQRLLQGPERVRLEGFTITVGPTGRPLTDYQARRVRDSAETVLENYLANFYESSLELQYDYVSLLGVSDVVWDGSSTPQTNTIHINGVLVVFMAGSTNIPPVETMKLIVKEALYPTGGGAGLLNSLQSIPWFKDLTTSSMEFGSPSSSMPSDIPSLTPSGVASLTPSRPDLLITSIGNEPIESTPSNGNRWLTMGASAGAVVAVGAILAISFLAVKRHREPTQPVTKALHDIDVADGNDDDDELKKTGLQNRDSLDRRNRDSSESASDASSLIGRVLSTASSIVVPTSSVLAWNGANRAQSPANTPQIDSDESDDDLGDSMNNLGGTNAHKSLALVAVMDMPGETGDASTVLSITNRSSQRGALGDEDVESFIMHHRDNHLSLHKDMLTSSMAAAAAGTTTKKNDRSAAPTSSSAAHTPPSSKKVLDPWKSGEISASPPNSSSYYLESSDDEGHYAPDSSWDFHDNRSSEEELQSANQFLTSKEQGGKSLLDRFFTRSSER